MKVKTQLVARAFAKVNLGLEVLGKRDDGYHELRTILQTVNLHDELAFRRENEGISLTTNDPDIGTGPENLVYRAASLLAASASSSGLGPKRRRSRSSRLSSPSVQSGGRCLS